MEALRHGFKLRRSAKVAEKAETFLFVLKSKDCLKKAVKAFIFKTVVYKASPQNVFG